MSSKIYDCIELIGNRIIENKEFLTELDREIGDADHGINMARGFTEVLNVLDKDSEDIGALFCDLHALAQPLGIVAHHGVVFYIDPDL